MSEQCTHDCGTCSSNCKSKQEDNKFKLNELSKVKKIIGVVSGKGGVGKSSITSLLATLFRRRGYKTAVLDADLTGPSIPKAFGLKGGIEGDENMLFPAVTKTGIEVMSINLMLEDESAPVLWRGPILGGVIKQFYEQTAWNEVDYMFVDMPPGTGDIPLTVFQSLNLSGVVVVTTPQELVQMIVEKVVKMAAMMNVKVLALVENMSYFICPNCNSKHYIFGEGKTEEAGKFAGIPVFTLPIDKDVASLEDKGLIELFEGDYLDGLCDLLEK